MRIAIVLVMGAVTAAAQTTVNGGRDFKGSVKASGSVSSVDFTGAASTSPVKTGISGARPASCTVGQIYFATDATAGQNLSFCTSAGVWSAMTGGSGGGSNGPGVSYCAPASASGTTYTCSPSPIVTAYAAGVTLAFVPDVAGAGGATTVNVNGLGAKSIKQADGSTNPVSTDLLAGRVYVLTYDGSVFRLGLNATNAANITSGTLAAARLPLPAASSVGGVQSKAAVTNQFLTAINTDGTVSSAQPAASNVTGLASSATVDTTNASNISSGTLADARLSSNVVRASGTNTYTGYNDVSGGSWRPPESTVSGLPAAASATGRVFMVTDALNAGSCSAGGGSVREVCRSNGSNYECVGNCGGGGGGGGSGTPGGTNGQMQYNNSGAFAGQPFVLSGSVFQRGVECSTGTVNYTALTANAPSQEVTILTSVPAKFRFLHMIVQEATLFASATVSSATVSAGRSGVDTDLIPAFALKSGTAPQNFWYDRPGTPVLGTGTYDVVLQFVGSGALGNGTVTNFSAGAVNWEVCGFSVP
jgi:hypothetical protein